VRWPPRSVAGMLGGFPLGMGLVGMGLAIE
jgi:hypothetical protein